MRLFPVLYIDWLYDVNIETFSMKPKLSQHSVVTPVWFGLIRYYDAFNVRSFYSFSTESLFNCQFNEDNMPTDKCKFDMDDDAKWSSEISKIIEQAQVNLEVKSGELISYHMNPTDWNM